MSNTPSNPWDNQPNQGGFPPPPNQPTGSTPQPGGSPYEPAATGQAPYGQAQYGQAPYGQATPGGFTPPPAKKTPWGKLLLGCGGILLVGALGIGACSFFLFRAATEPIDNTNDFLAAVRDGDVSRAQELVADGCDADAAINAVSSVGQVDRYQIGSYNNSNGAETVSGTITIDGIPRSIEVAIRDDKVCRVGI